MNGKGSKRRPLLISSAQFEANWDAVFGHSAADTPPEPTHQTLQPDRGRRRAQSRQLEPSQPTKHENLQDLQDK